MADVVVGAPLGHARHHRQHRLGPVQGLDPGLLVHAQHHRLLGRVVVEADDVDDLVHELRIGGQLEGVLQVGLEVEPPPDPPDRRLRQAAARGHRGPRPVRRVRRGLLQRRHHHVLDLVEQDRRRPARARLVDQTLEPVRHEPGTPAGHRPWRHPQLGGDLLVRQPVGAAQHDLRPQRQRLRGLRPPRPPRQLLPLGIGQHQLGLRPPRPQAVDQPVAAGPANRLRHLPTVIVVTPRSAATRSYTTPGSAHASTIFARTASRADPPPCDHREQLLPLVHQSARTRHRHAPRETSKNHNNLSRKFTVRHTSPTHHSAGSAPARGATRPDQTDG